MLNVAIYGYGKIGSIKAEKYRSLNHNVYIYDNDPNKVELAKSKGFISNLPDKVFPNGNIDVVEVCVPTSNHYEIVTSILTNIVDLKRPLISIEKPLTDSRRTLNLFKDLIKNDHKFIVAENYFFSEGLRELKSHIPTNQTQVKRIYIEFTKNRISDVKQGRFLDKNLHSLGIEFPHALAILHSLGQLSNTDIESFKEFDLKVGDKLHMAQGGCHISLKNSGGVLCEIYQSLSGNLSEEGLNLLNYLELSNSIETLRFVKVEFQNNDFIYLIFDPVPGLVRYKAKLIESNGATTVVDDDMILNTIKHIVDLRQDIARLDQSALNANIAFNLNELILDIKS